ncbi:MAG: response regulator [Pseudomonadota bacterium]|nr:response regulator [Pseudomonadota bacterium]
MNRTREILLVEDSPSDAFLTREALRGLGPRLHVVNDGVEAMQFLRREPPFADAPRPDLILLDLNTPRMDGREVLAAIKQDAHLRCIPVIVLTSSTREADLNVAYDLHANCYVAKPTDFNQFREAIRLIETFWFHLASLPPGEAPR